MGAGPCKLLLCSGGGGGVVRMAMRAAPNDSEIQIIGEKLLALIEATISLEIGDYIPPDTRIAIIHEMDKIEDLGADVESLFFNKSKPALEAICNAFKAADTALRPILTALTAGWEVTST